MTFKWKLWEDGKALSMTWVLSPFPLFTAVQYRVVLFSPNHFTPTSSEEHDSCVPVETVKKKEERKQERTKSKAIKRQGIMFARGAISASYLFRTTHLFKTAAIKSAPSDEMQSEMFRLLWQHVCLHLWRHKQSLSSISQETRRTPFCKAHKASMLCEDHNYWHPCVKILCLWKAVPSVSGITLLGRGGGEGEHTVWTDCQTDPWKTTGILHQRCVEQWMQILPFCYLRFQGFT